MSLNSSRDKLALLLQNSATDVSVGFRPPCSMPDMTSDSGLNLLNSFDF